MNQDQIDSLVRSLLKVVGGILAAHGLTATAGIVNSTNVTELISGIVVTLIGFYASHTNAATDAGENGDSFLEPLAARTADD